MNRRSLLNNRWGDVDPSRPMNVTLMMLILAFFIVLNTMAVPAESKKKIALGSLTGSLGILPGGLSPMSSTARNVAAKGAPLLDDKKQLSYLLGKFEEQLIHTRTAQFARTFVSHGGVAVILDNRILFEPGSARLSREGEGIVQRLGPLFRQAEGGLLVESHVADPKGGSGRFPDAISLTAARAGTVARFMIADAKIDPTRLGVAGYGAMRPLTAVEGFDDALKNDRTEVRYRWTL
ncbi:MAG: OmpA family protein [Nitrospinae bacterium]|nr:OmpA family protein [Nitrospinota bacterium]